MDRDQFIWEHFKFNAEQRMRVFNFYIVLSSFVVGGVLTSIEKNLAPLLIGGIGVFACILAGVFWILDVRSQWLIRIAIPALKDMEAKYPENARLFAIDEVKQGKVFRYSFAFKALLIVQLVFGIGVIIYACVQSST